MTPDQTINIDYTQWKVVMCNNTYATVEKVGSEKEVRIIRVCDYV
jgi:hypothetical protein